MTYVYKHPASILLMKMRVYLNSNMYEPSFNPEGICAELGCSLLGQGFNGKHYLIVDGSVTAGDYRDSIVDKIVPEKSRPK